MDVKVCEHPPYTKRIPYKNAVVTKDDIVGALKELEEWRSETIRKIDNGEKTTCHGCSALQWGYWPKNPTIRVFAVGPNFKSGTICNCRCFYCNQHDWINRQSEQDLSVYDVYKIGSEIYSDIHEIVIADGEPSLWPDLPLLCELVNEKHWTVWFNTNCIVYSEAMADSISRNKDSFVSVALDCGTSATYKKIKRVDKFDNVVENLRKYKQKGCKVYPKYILCPGYNDNVEDINKFIELSKDIGVDAIVLSQNLSKFNDGVKGAEDPDMPESMFAWFCYITTRLKEEGFTWSFQPEFISSNDAKRISKLH